MAGMSGISGTQATTTKISWACRAGKRRQYRCARCRMGAYVLPRTKFGHMGAPRHAHGRRREIDQWKIKKNISALAS